MKIGSIIIANDLNTINFGLWLDENNNFIMNEEISAFGLGKRNCVGKAFAIKALQLILSLLIFRYNFKLNEEQQDIKYDETKTFTIPPPEIPVKIIKREEIITNTIITETEYEVKNVNDDEEQIQYQQCKIMERKAVAINDNISNEYEQYE